MRCNRSADKPTDSGLSLAGFCAYANVSRYNVSNRAPAVCFIVLFMIFAPERFFFVIEGFPFLSRHEPPEEAISPPLRAFVAIGDGLRYAQVNAIEIRRRFKINRLLQIFRRRVIAFGAPAFDDLVLRRAFDKSDLQRSRRNAALDEAVLIAAREGIALRFRVGEDLQLQLTARGLQIIREVGFLQPLYNQTAQRKQR